MHFWDAGSTDEDVGSAGRTFHKRFSRPTIELDGEQNINQISFNNQVRSSQPFTSHKSTKQVYQALQLFNTISYQEFSVKYKMEMREAKKDIGVRLFKWPISNLVRSLT